MNTSDVGVNDMNKEEAYDAEINHLMAEIIAICKKHKIAMLCHFEIPTKEDDTLCCTTGLMSEEFSPSTRLRRLGQMAICRSPGPLMVNTYDSDGKIVRSDAVLP